MKRQTLLQLVTGGVAVLLLSYLYLFSQVNHQQHLLVTTSLQSLKEYDLQLSQGVIQHHTGIHKNFDFIGLVQQKITREFAYLAGQLDAFDHDDVALEASVKAIDTVLRQKKQKAERYKYLSALNLLSRHYLPSAYKELLVSLSGSARRSERTMQDLGDDISRLYHDLNHFIAGYTQVESKVQRRLGKLEALQIDHAGGLDDKLGRFLWNVRTVMETTAKLEALVQQINHFSTTKKIESLQHDYVQRFNQRSGEALQYRQMLFASSILLLFYLAVILMRLRRTRTDLEVSLNNLEFRKKALDCHAIISCTDSDGKITYVNQKFCDTTGYTRKELLGRSHRLLKSGRHDHEFFVQMWDTLCQGQVWQGEVCNRAKDGSEFWVETTILPRLDGQGQPYEYIAVRTDITSLKKAESEAQAAARFPMENPDPVMRIDADGRLVFHNLASYMILDHWHVKLNDPLPGEWREKVRQILQDGKMVEFEVNVFECCYHMTFVPVVESEYVNIYGRNITEKKEAEASLSYQATHDGLTDLVNRNAFETELEKVLSGIQQDERRHVLLYVDLDQFKVVNDTCGHVAGDELLRQLSQMMLCMFRENDVLARLGGDEFGILLRNCDVSMGEKIAGELLDMIHQYRFIWDDRQFEIGASIGLVEINENSESTVMVMGQADVACYAAKDAGRHQIKVFKDDDSESTQRQSEMHWASQIPKALADNRFCLMVQTIAPLGDAVCKPHYEILVRMLDEQGGYVPPGAFIPAAERYNLMPLIDMWVVSHTFEFIQNYLEHNGQEALPVLAINLSGGSMGNEELFEFIRERIEELRLPAGSICFEVTETAAIGNLNKAVDFIERLKQCGCQFALDDFGCGLSSFEYLKSLPVDYLKIDGSFVKDMVDDPIDASMVEAINQVGHIMAIRTIAEFVENQQIVDALTRIGVDYAQGYHIDKPTPLYEKFPVTLPFEEKQTG